jgi:putative tricarboxylic transport membrane protein
MLIARGDPTTFVTRPISGVLLAIAAVLVLVALLPMIRGKRDEVFVESET